MKKILHFLFGAFLVFISANTKAQTPVINVCPYLDSMWTIDTATMVQNYPGIPLTSSTGSILGCNGLAVQPCTGKIFIVYKANTSRYLGILNPITGVITEIGDMGDNVANICFGSPTHLYAVTGDGASTPETLFKVNIATGAMTTFVSLGNGDDGESIGFNPDDGKIYHWSGLNVMVMESIDTLTGVVTNIPMSGTTYDEVTAALYVGNGVFALADINQDVTAVGINGAGISYLTSTDDGIKGLVYPLTYISNTHPSGVFCDNDSVTLTHIPASSYQWYLNGTPITGATTSSITVNSGGDYTCDIISGGCSITSDTVSLTIQNSPVVAITPANTASFCSGDSVLLTGSSGGTSQWYVDGSMIAGATTNTHYASSGGLYNMIKTNTNGCSDSAATGTLVTENNLPVVTMTPSTDSTICVGDSVEFTSSTGSNYQWMMNGIQISGGTMSTYFASTPGIFNVLVEDGNGCTDSAAAGVAVIHDSTCYISVEELGLSNLNIYPNPTNDQLTVSFVNHNNESVNMKLLSLDGRVILDKKLNSTSGESLNTIDVSDVVAGIYLIQLQIGEKVLVERITISD